MIIKGKGRGRALQLAIHLLRTDDNERVELFERRGTVATDVEGALIEMEARAAAVRTARPLYHASISPDARTPLTDTQIRIAVDTLEAKLGLAAQPRIVVVHRKKGREHLHVVWSRIDLDRGRVISDAWNYRCHEEASRELEKRFGHAPVESSLARWDRPSPRRRRAPKDYEYRQQERSGRQTDGVTAELTAIWRASHDADAFRARLEEAGYTLARGDRRVFVVIDRKGEVHSLAMRITRVTTHDIRARLAAVRLPALPSVAEVRAARPAAPSQRMMAPAFVAAAQEVTRPMRRRLWSRDSTSPYRRTVVAAHDAVIEITRPAREPIAVKPARVTASRAACRTIIAANARSSSLISRPRSPPPSARHPARISTPF